MFPLELDIQRFIFEYASIPTNNYSDTVFSFVSAETRPFSDGTFSLSRIHHAVSLTTPVIFVR